MCHFMTNYSANTTIVYSIICSKIKERKLQDASREYDLVIAGIVIGIDRRRRHTPTVFVNWLSPATDHVVVSPLAGTLAIAQEIIAVNSNSTIILPLVRISNLLGKCI